MTTLVLPAATKPLTPEPTLTPAAELLSPAVKPLTPAAKLLTPAANSLIPAARPATLVEAEAGP